MSVVPRWIGPGFIVFSMFASSVAHGGEDAISNAAPSSGETAASSAAADVTGGTSTTDGHSWRYRKHEGRWWYWMPSNRWVVWMDGRWVDPPTQALETEPAEISQYHAVPSYGAPAPSPAARLLQPRPRDWYYSGGVYDGPYYYYDEFYEPYGGARPYPYYPEPRINSRRPYYGPNRYYPQPGVGITIGNGSSVRFGFGF